MATNFEYTIMFRDAPDGADLKAATVRVSPPAIKEGDEKAEAERRSQALPDQVRLVYFKGDHSDPRIRAVVDVIQHSLVEQALARLKTCVGTLLPKAADQAHAVHCCAPECRRPALFEAGAEPSYEATITHLHQLRVCGMQWDPVYLFPQELVCITHLLCGAPECERAMAHKCSGCGRPEPVKSEDKKHQTCGRCHVLYYCGKECQAAHWPTHKDKCRAPAAPPPPAAESPEKQ